MKKIICIIFSCTLFMIACHDDLIVPSKSEISTTSMWQTESDAVAAMNGMFYRMRSVFSTNYAYWGDYRSGLFTRSSSLVSDIIDAGDNTIDNTNTAALWQNIYTLINVSNLIIKHVPNIDFLNDENKNKVLANAYFVRAFAYYYIVRIWGNAPLLLTGFESDTDDLYPTRTSADKIYTHVATDIDMALHFMPSSVVSKITASVGCINMLKADYYMWMAKTQNGGSEAYSKAQEALSAVLSNSQQYMLSSDYGTIFTNKTNAENIFSIHFEKDEFEGGFAENYLFGPNYVLTPSLITDGSVIVGTLSTQQQRVLFTTAYENFLYEYPNDQRAKVSYRIYKETKRTYKWINKYVGEWINSTRYFTSDVIVYRLADAILFQAELYNATGKTASAVVELNKVAKRAYGVENMYSTSLSKDEVDKLIVDERMKEFASEGKIWWDYIRFGVAFKRVPSLVGRESEPNILLWPVHQNSLNTNPNIKQTEGYE